MNEEHLEKMLFFREKVTIISSKPVQTKYLLQNYTTNPYKLMLDKAHKSPQQGCEKK